MSDKSEYPDIRDGLTHKERVILFCLREIEQEHKARGGITNRFVATPMLYGRVVEYVDMSENELQLILAKWAK